jgi:hypothetical protein
MNYIILESRKFSNWHASCVSFFISGELENSFSAGLSAESQAFFAWQRGTNDRPQSVLTAMPR